MYRFAMLGLSAMLGFLLYQGCKSPTVAHSGEKPLYELRGLHTAVPCAGCHGTGTPKSVSRLCADCHEAARPDPSHNAGKDCGTSGCHNELPPAWLNGTINTGETGLTPPTGETGPTGDTGIIIEEDPIHDNLTTETMCMSSGCHDAASGDRKDADHYANPLRPILDWDCGSCHATGLPGTGWLVDLVLHPTRTPHGTTYNNGEVLFESGRWVIACEDCHQDLTDYTKFECSTCHNGLGAIPAQKDLWATGSHLTAPEPGPAADALCEDCHTYGDLEDLTP